MTETLTIRLPKSLAREFRAKTRAAKTNPTEVLRKAAASYVREDQTARNAIVEHIRARAGLIGYYDLIVAATALERGSQIATFNKRHFALIGGLNIVEPK